MADLKGNYHPELRTLLLNFIILLKKNDNFLSFGYIDFARPEQGEAAVRLSGKLIDGRQIKVDIDQGSGISSTIFVGNLSYEVTPDHLREYFKDCGEIISARIPTFPENGKSKGFGYVQFNDTNSAQEAMKMYNHSDFYGRTIRIDYAGERDPANSNGPGNRGGFSGRGFSGNRGGFSGRSRRNGYRGRGSFGNRGGPSYQRATPQGTKIRFED